MVQWNDFCTYNQYSNETFNRPGSAGLSNIRDGVLASLSSTAVKLGDAGLNCSYEIRIKVVGDGICYSFIRDNFPPPEVASDASVFPWMTSIWMPV